MTKTLEAVRYDEVIENLQRRISRLRSHLYGVRDDSSDGHAVRLAYRAIEGDDNLSKHSIEPMQEVPVTIEDSERFVRSIIDRAPKGSSQ
jgi:hypothetical protein